MGELWLSEITVCLGRGGWQQDHFTMTTVSKGVMSLAKVVMSAEDFPVVPAAASAQHRAPTAADSRLRLSFFLFLAKEVVASR